MTTETSINDSHYGFHFHYYYWSYRIDFTSNLQHLSLSWWSLINKHQFTRIKCHGYFPYYFNLATSASGSSAILDKDFAYSIFLPNLSPPPESLSYFSVADVVSVLGNRVLSLLQSRKGEGMEILQISQVETQDEFLLETKPKWK